MLLSAKEILPKASFLEALLQILTTDPVTTATNERSFSVLKYLENLFAAHSERSSFKWIGIVVCSL